MQEAFALGAVFASFLSYIVLAIGPSDQRLQSSVTKPVQAWEIVDNSPVPIEWSEFWSGDLHLFDPRGRLAKSAARRSGCDHSAIHSSDAGAMLGAHHPSPTAPTSLMAGRAVSVSQLGSSEQCGPASSGRLSDSDGFFAKQSGTVESCADPRFLRRRSAEEQKAVDPLSEDVIRRYRSYAGELALLRQEHHRKRQIMTIV